MATRRMNFPPFWAKGTYRTLFCGLVNHSPGEAQSAAKELQELSRTLPRETPFIAMVTRSNRCVTGVAGNEERSGDVAAAITRIPMVLVLNTARVMFVDVDCGA